MKVRWTTGSVRFRITPTELRDLTIGRPVSTTLAVLGGAWTATLSPSADRTGIALSGGDLTLSLTDVDVRALSEPEREGVYFTVDEPWLKYFVEKDFPCVHPKPEEAKDLSTETFAPPSGFAERHQVDRSPVLI